MPNFTTLHSNPHLLKESVKLLNEEWPRSDGSREHSQNKSCRSSPPMSFLLINDENEGEEEELIGHARVCLLPNRENALWIESVLIKKQYRGKKLGKCLMYGVEAWMVQNGFIEAYLVTDDQVEFYKSCGYEKCEPIVHSTTATSVFPAMLRFQFDAPNNPPAPVPKTTIVTENQNVSNSSIPPPPPPPPTVQPPKTRISTVNHQYMHKLLK